MTVLQLQAYNEARSAEWDAVVRRSVNGTFLLTRPFMDYHADRFRDCSLLIYKGAHAQAVFPACWSHDSASGRPSVESHGGLTYGGLIVTDKMTGADVVDTYQLLAAHYRQLGAANLRVKPLPSVYHRQPSQAEIYALHRLGATIDTCALSSAITLPHPLPFISDRARAVRKARRAEISVSEGREAADVEAFHALLSQVLGARHQRRPVHTSDEMKLLMSRFPNEIRLFLATDPSGRLLAGTWVFDCGPCVHTQYMAVSDSGRQCGALDLIIDHLVSAVFRDRQFFDFGISTEQGGQWLNRPLLFQKEGFGGRGVCYNSYLLSLGAPSAGIGQ